MKNSILKLALSILVSSLYSFSASASASEEALNVALMCFGQSAAQTYSCALADVNGDGEVNRRDQRGMQKHERQQIRYFQKNGKYPKAQDLIVTAEDFQKYMADPNAAKIFEQPSVRVRLHVACDDESGSTVLSCSELDADGDGEINALDVQAILNNY